MSITSPVSPQDRTSPKELYEPDKAVGTIWMEVYAPLEAKVGDKYYAQFNNLSAQGFKNVYGVDRTADPPSPTDKDPYYGKFVSVRETTPNGGFKYATVEMDDLQRSNNAAQLYNNAVEISKAPPGVSNGHDSWVSPVLHQWQVDEANEAYKFFQKPDTKMAAAKQKEINNRTIGIEARGTPVSSSAATNTGAVGTTPSGRIVAGQDELVNAPNFQPQPGLNSKSSLSRTIF